MAARPRLEWLETFLAIAECGSFSRAAERTARSQSAVSLQLRRLEQVLGTSVFARDTRHVRLTPAGERLLPCAHRALEAADAAVLAARGAPRVALRVGVPEEYADRLIPALVDGVGRHDLELAFEIECAASAALARGVAARRLDLAFALAEEVAEPGLPVLREPVVWLQAPGSLAGERRPLPVALFDSECSWKARAVEALEGAAIDYRVVATSPSVAGVRSAIRAGIAVGALADSTAGDALERLHGDGAPPALGHTELVLLGAAAREPRAAAILGRVRRHLMRRYVPSTGPDP